MLRSVNDFHGVVVDGTDCSIGQIDDLYFDDQAWTIRFLLVKTGAWLEGRKVLISPIAAGEPNWDRRLLPVSVTPEQVRMSPDVDSHKPVARQHESEQYYLGGSRIWGDGMRPRMMLAAYGGAKTPQARGQEAEFVRSQADMHRRRGDDPHLRSFSAVIRYHVHASDGEIGHVDGMIVDDETWTVRNLVVNTSDWWLGHQVLVAPEWISEISWLEATVAVDLSRERPSSTPRPTTPTRCPIASKNGACTNTTAARGTGPTTLGRKPDWRLAESASHAALLLHRTAQRRGTSDLPMPLTGRATASRRSTRTSLRSRARPSDASETARHRRPSSAPR